MLDDLGDPTAQLSRGQKKTERLAPGHIDTQFITRTDYDALVAASGTSSMVLYAIDETA